VIVQQPGSGNTQPVPHSSPGRTQLLEVCGSGPQTGRTLRPLGPVATIARLPAPLIRQATFTSVFAVIPGPERKSSAHTVAPVPAPCRSTRPFVAGPADAPQDVGGAGVAVGAADVAAVAGGSLGASEVQAVTTATTSPAPTIRSTAGLPRRRRTPRSLAGMIGMIGMIGMVGMIGTAPR